MHKEILTKRNFFADRRQPAVRIPPKAVFSYPGHSGHLGNDAVRGSQFAEYMLLGVAGNTISAVIASYTFNDPSSVAVSARVLSRPARVSRSTPDLLLLASG